MNDANTNMKVACSDRDRIFEHQLFVGRDQLARALVGHARHLFERAGADARHAQERGHHLVLVRVGARELGDHAARQIRRQGTL